MKFDSSYYEDEVREGFFVPGMMKRFWAAQTDLLETIGNLCNKHNIKWYAIWGTLLGAARHKGFIPWDDDIDICMFRDDYIRFREIAKVELPTYKILDFQSSLEWEEFLMRIVDKPCAKNTNGTNPHHGFPFLCGIDIFPLDYLAPTEDEMETHRLRTAYIWELARAISNHEIDKSNDEIIADVERLCGVSVDRNLPLKPALLRANEAIFKEYNEVKSDQVTIIPYWLENENHKFPIDWFERTEELPFETIAIPVPGAYREVLSTQFGAWETPIRSGGDHDYPLYAQYEAALAEKADGKIPYKYYFSPDDLKNDGRQQNSLEADSNLRALQMVFDFQNILEKLNPTEDTETMLQLLEKCQELAIQIGTSIEKERGDDHKTVKLMEEYCELIYQFYTKLLHGEKINVDQECRNLTAFLNTVEYSYRNDRRKEIVFFPFKSTYWDTMQPLYEAVLAEACYDVSVIPIPYYEMAVDGTMGKKHYDMESYPEDLPLLGYHEYDYLHKHPDIMVIQNPYDEYGSAISVNPFFYAKNLKQYTEKLVYVPYFTLDEIQPGDEKSLINASRYAVSPGVVHSDQVIVQSENLKKVYVDALTAAAGESTRAIWENKICTELSL